MSVYAKIAAVMADLSSTGIGKDQKNTFDKYNFRGIDDCYNVVGPVLAKHKLVIIPEIENTVVEPVQTSKGALMNHATVQVKYTMVDAESDSTKVEARFPGEATDRGDKAINKAMSAAYKSFLFQTFCIPTEGQGHDSEEESHEHVAQPIGEDEINEIRGWLERTLSDEAAFLAWQKVESLTEIPMARYAHAIEALRRKYERMEAMSGQAGEADREAGNE